MEQGKYLVIHNGSSVDLSSVPMLDYADFYQECEHLLHFKRTYVLSYFVQKVNDSQHRAFIFLTHNTHGEIYLLGTNFNSDNEYPALSAKHLCVAKFEAEIHENAGVKFSNHPWLKPVRYAWNRFDPSTNYGNYSFFKVDSPHIHEVGVGPIHAGVIEPGHFRFNCNGEEILHLEIQLGFQHRGIEQLMLQNKKMSYRLALSEAIAGDTAVGHSWAYTKNVEALSGVTVSDHVEIIRMILLELERIASHTGDIGNLCIGLAYLPGSTVLGKLRGTPLNMMMQITGDRFGKGALWPGGLRCTISDEKTSKLLNMLHAFEEEFTGVCELILEEGSVLARTYMMGCVSQEQIYSCGFTGLVAKMNSIERDVRQSHPWGWYKQHNFETYTTERGDIKARTRLRIEEVKQSVIMVRNALQLLKGKSEESSLKKSLPPLSSEKICISMVEGFRGVITHVAITDAAGELSHYKITDPSFVNWLALALACRNVGISDFPINNKSFNQSYCGHDL